MLLILAISSPVLSSHSFWISYSLLFPTSPLKMFLLRSLITSVLLITQCSNLIIFAQFEAFNSANHCLLLEILSWLGFQDTILTIFVAPSFYFVGLLILPTSAHSSVLVWHSWTTDLLSSLTPLRSQQALNTIFTYMSAGSPPPKSKFLCPAPYWIIEVQTFLLQSLPNW